MNKGKCPKLAICYSDSTAPLPTSHYSSSFRLTVHIHGCHIRDLCVCSCNGFSFTIFGLSCDCNHNLYWLVRFSAANQNPFSLREQTPHVYPFAWYCNYTFWHKFIFSYILIHCDVTWSTKAELDWLIRWLAGKVWLFDFNHQPTQEAPFRPK